MHCMNRLLSVREKGLHSCRGVRRQGHSLSRPVTGPPPREILQIDGPSEENWRSIRSKATSADRHLASEGERPKAVVVGSGWAGFGAAKALTDEGYDVTIVDAQENPGGLVRRNGRGIALPISLCDPGDLHRRPAGAPVMAGPWRPASRASGTSTGTYSPC